MTKMKWPNRGGSGSHLLPYKPVKSKKRQGQSLAGYKPIRAKFPSQCQHCNKPIYKGRYVMWSPKKDRGVTHPECLKPYVAEKGWKL